MFESRVDQDFQKLSHLQREMSRSSLLEEISKQVSDPNEKINLHELIETSNAGANLVSPKSLSTSFFDKKYSAAQSQSFSLANVTNAARSANNYFSAFRKPPTPKHNSVAKVKKTGSQSDSFINNADSNLLQIETTEQEEEASA